MENKCVNCARFPFCADASANKKDCENFVSRDGGR